MIDGKQATEDNGKRKWDTKTKRHLPFPGCSEWSFFLLGFLITVDPSLVLFSL